MTDFEKFTTIVADPPWRYPNPGDFVRQFKSDGEQARNVSSERLYGSLGMDDLKAMPVERHAADRAHLYLWTTNGFMREAHDLAEAWGFDVKTILTWTKVKADGTPSMKMGYYFRGATEHVLFATRGKSMKLRSEVGLPTAMLWPRTPHSVKPDAFYDLVEEASPGPYLELFARRQRPGWSHWGNEVECDVDIPTVPASDPAG